MNCHTELIINQIKYGDLTKKIKCPICKNKMSIKKYKNEKVLRTNLGRMGII